MGCFRGRPVLITRGASLAAMVSSLRLRPWMADSPGSALSRRNDSINGSWNRSEIGCSWTLLIAELVVSHFVTEDRHVVSPEMNPLMCTTLFELDSEDPPDVLSVKSYEKLRTFVFFSFSEDFKVYNCNSTPGSLASAAACRSNIMYHVFRETSWASWLRTLLFEFSAAELLEVSDMNKRIK
jgi:hypothetical protein